jgi:DNA-binding transcriptional regulator YdaS (Cro superfamily)
MSNGLKQAIAYYGSLSALARAAGVWPNAVVWWQRNGVPAQRCVELEKLTRIPRERLNPKIFGRAAQRSARR